MVRDPFSGAGEGPAKAAEGDEYPGIVGPVIHNVVLTGKLVVRDRDGVEIKRPFTVKEMNRIAVFCNGRRNEKFPGYTMITLTEPTPATAMIFVTGKVVMPGVQKISHLHMCSASLAGYLLKNMWPEWTAAHVIQVEVTNLMGVLYMGYQLSVDSVHKDVKDSSYHPDNICSVQIERLLKRKQEGPQVQEKAPMLGQQTSLPKRRRKAVSKDTKEKEKVFKESAVVYHTGNCVLTGTNDVPRLMGLARSAARFLSKYREVDRPVLLRTDKGDISNEQWIATHEKTMCSAVDTL